MLPHSHTSFSKQLSYDGMFPSCLERAPKKYKEPSMTVLMLSRGSTQETIVTPVSVCFWNEIRVIFDPESFFKRCMSSFMILLHSANT